MLNRDQQTTEFNQQDDEITLKELVLKVREYSREIKRNWKIVSFCVVISTAIFLYFALTTKATYNARLSFMVREDSGNALGAVSGLLGQFGLGGSTTEFNLDKIAELSKARQIVQQAFFEKVTINGKHDYIANHIIDLYNLQKKWSTGDDNLLKDFRFSNGVVDSFDIKSNKALQSIYKLTVDNGNKTLLKTDFSRQTTILYLNATTVDQMLSIHLANKVYDKLSRFYVIQSTAQPRQTVNNLEERADSIKNVLYSSQKRLARTEDRSLGTLLREDKVPAAQLGKDIQILTLIYAEILKNLETASFLLKNATPFFMAIDQPFAPIKPTKKSKSIAILTGVAVGFLLAAFIIIVRKLFRDAMAAPQ